MTKEAVAPSLSASLFAEALQAAVRTQLFGANLDPSFSKLLKSEVSWWTRCNVKSAKILSYESWQMLLFSIEKHTILKICTAL